VQTFSSNRNRPAWLTGRPRKGRTYSPWGIGDASSPSAMPMAFELDIAGDGAGGYHLVFYSMDRVYSADTWHETLEDAYATAEEAFGIRRDEWGPPLGP
jgi:hypothetical protein